MTQTDTRPTFSDSNAHINAALVPLLSLTIFRVLSEDPSALLATLCYATLTGVALTMLPPMRLKYAAEPAAHRIIYFGLLLIAMLCAAIGHSQQGGGALIWPLLAICAACIFAPPLKRTGIFAVAGMVCALGLAWGLSLVIK